MTLKQLINDLTIWFDGKKTYINSVALILIPYLVATGYINAELAAVITGIIGILTGAGKYVADDAIRKENELGIALKQKREK